MKRLKVVGYEVKRLLLSKVYLVLLTVTVLFSYYILSSKTIMGTAYTAPFWSYSAFLCSVNPFLLEIILFFCTYVFSKNEFAVRNIMLTTPFAELRYYILKAAVILLTYMITAVLVIAVSLLFYAGVFKFYNFGDFAGSVVIYALIPVVLIVGNTDVPGLGNFGPFGSWFANYYPHEVVADASGDVPFILPQGFTPARLLWTALGIIMFFIAVVVSKRKSINN